MSLQRSRSAQPLPGGGRELARPEGLEPPTPRFEAWCSIRLSYGRGSPMIALREGPRDSFSSSSPRARGRVRRPAARGRPARRAGRDRARKTEGPRSRGGDRPRRGSREAPGLRARQRRAPGARVARDDLPVGLGGEAVHRRRGDAPGGGGTLALDDPLDALLSGRSAGLESHHDPEPAHHTSGIADYGSANVDYRRDYSDDEFARMAFGLKLEFPPGTRFSYSNTGYALWGSSSQGLGPLLRRRAGGTGVRAARDEDGARDERGGHRSQPGGGLRLRTASSRTRTGSPAAQHHGRRVALPEPERSRRLGPRPPRRGPC